MSGISFKLEALLEALSYHLIITAIGFGFAGGMLHFEASSVATALETTAGSFIVLSLLFYRLSQHNR